jgi:hypothetical protein
MGSAVLMMHSQEVRVEAKESIKSKFKTNLSLTHFL